MTGLNDSGLVGKSQVRGALIIESAAAGIAFGALLCWGSACLVAVFRPNELAMPYWASVPGLRTDTAGALAFFIAASAIVVSEYLRLRGRRYQAAAFVPHSDSAWPFADMAQAVSRAVMILATGLVCYLSFNTVTHPVTEQVQVTHLLPWPTEGTVRILALVLVVIAVAIRRFGQRIVPAGPARPASRSEILAPSAATDA